MTLTDLSDEISPFPDAGNILYGDHHHHRRCSSPLRKLRPFRSSSTNGGGGGGEGEGEDSPPKADGSSSSSLPLDDCDSGGDATAAATPNPSSFSKEEEGPLWEIVAEKLEQMGYQPNSNNKKDKQEEEDPYNGIFTQLQALRESSEENPVEIANMLVSLHTTSTDFASHSQEEVEQGEDGNKPEDEQGIVQTLNYTKKRKTMMACTQLELFLFHMVDKLVKKQDQMHKQLMDIIDKHDKDRISREEAWRQQELDRQNRDKELRDQQNTRNLALISFIEKLLGHQIHFPQTLSPSEQHHEQRDEQAQQDCKIVSNTQRWHEIEVQDHLEQHQEQGDAGHDQAQQDCKALVSCTQMWPQTEVTALEQHQAQGDRLDQSQEECQLVSCTKRWPESEVKALVTVRTAMDLKFRSLEPKHNIWEEVSLAMSSLGYSRNAKKCKEKWENINKYFKKTVGRGKRPKSSKTCPYFHELDALYRNGTLNPGSAHIEMTNNGESWEPTHLNVSV